VLEGNWAGTIFSEHPGVTVMWLSGSALWAWHGIGSLLGLDSPAPLDTEGFAFFDRVTVGILPLALLVSLGIVWGFFLLRRLFGDRVAWVGALLWALDPFFLANSKVLHLDATLSTLMILSALWMMIYLRERDRKQLAIAGVLGGLAILTKISALYLIPYLGLCLLVGWLPSLREGQAFTGLRVAAVDLLLWTLIAVVVCFLLWPALWSQPGPTLDRVIMRGIVFHVEEAHHLPRFYRGELAVGDPGTGFYLDVIALRLTAITLPFGLVGLLSSLARDQADCRRETLLIAAFATFFLLQMTLGGRKEERYMLPVILAWNILSAQGIVWWTDRVRAFAPRAATILLFVMVFAQAIIALPLHPYYDTHYNLALGGRRAAARVLPLADFGEGLDQAARYVEGLPGSESLTVATQFLANEMVTQYVRAPVYDLAETGDDVDVLVFGVQYTTRGPSYPRWGELWEQYKYREPEFVASFGGIPYAWVHRPAAEPVIPHQTDLRLGEEVQLVGYRLAGEDLVPGDSVVLTLYWMAAGEIQEDYTVFVHLLGEDGELIAQQDNPPGRGSRPTSGWEAGALIEDQYELPFPDDRSMGEYALSVGMYNSATIERLDVISPDGQRLPEDRAILTTVQVSPMVPPWWWTLSGLWFTLVLGGCVGYWKRGER
jgi:hypothetical protein